MSKSKGNVVTPMHLLDAYTADGVRYWAASARLGTDTAFDEKMLKGIAEKTGGRYFRATDAQTLSRVYREIDALERSEFVEQRFRQYQEYFPYALGLGLLLATLAWFLQATLLRRLPQ
jgi:leucyl-tRNA synthetase